MKPKSVKNERQAILGEFTQEFSVAKESHVSEQLSSEIETELLRIDRRLRRDNPFRESQSALQRAENELEQDIATIDRLERDFVCFQALAKQTNSRIDETYWLSEFENIKENEKDTRNFTDGVVKQLFEEPTITEKLLKQKEHEEKVVCRTLLLQQWRKLVDEQVAKWEIETTRKLRRRLLDRLMEWLKRLQLLADTLDELSIEPGLLFDLSKDNLTLSDIEQLKKWVSYISKDEGVKALCDLMGRLRFAEQTTRQELVKTVSTVTEYVPDINSREEIVGVYMGKDIEHALPQEIALLSDDDTSVLFDITPVQNRF